MFHDKNPFFSPLGFQVLQIEMSQKLQNEEESS